MTAAGFRRKTNPKTEEKLQEKPVDHIKEEDKPGQSPPLEEKPTENVQEENSVEANFKKYKKKQHRKIKETAGSRT